MPFHGIAGQDLKGQAREDWKEKVKQGKLGNKNPNWKGGAYPQIFDGYFSLHRWVKRQLPRPKFCQRCGLRPALDCANKSDNYRRDLNDWWWLCKRCHMDIDGRLHRRTPDGRFSKRGG